MTHFAGYLLLALDLLCVEDNTKISLKLPILYQSLSQHQLVDSYIRLMDDDVTYKSNHSVTLTK